MAKDDGTSVWKCSFFFCGWETRKLRASSRFHKETKRPSSGSENALKLHESGCHGVRRVLRASTGWRGLPLLPLTVARPLQWNECDESPAVERVRFSVEREVWSERIIKISNFNVSS